MTSSRHSVQLPITLAYAKGAYSAKLSLGSERATANVMLDTGSSTLAVMSKTYAPNRDSSLRATALAQHVTYGKGAWAGPVLHSDIGIGDGEHARSLPAAPFAFVETDARSFFRDADGILGLAYRHLNTAHDLAALLTEQGRAPALTWPWPFSDVEEADVVAFTDRMHEQPRVSVEPFFSALEAHGVVADKFAMLIRRALVHVLDDTASADQLADDPLNRGVLVLGGGEEHQSLYDGAFQDIRILHELYYNANLISVQVGSETPIPAPALLEEFQAGAGSNAIIDTGSSFIVAEATIFDAIIAAFGRHDERLPGLVARFQKAFETEQGVPNAVIDPKDWPDLHFHLESASGDVVRLTCAPSHYWQRNALVAGQSFFLLLRQVPSWPNQSILGLPLLSGRYCVFDRRREGKGVVRLAKAAE
ncbi:MAG: pepsin-like aspartic protease [Tahibacter sp.]